MDPPCADLTQKLLGRDHVDPGCVVAASQDLGICSAHDSVRNKGMWLGTVKNDVAAANFCEVKRAYFQLRTTRYERFHALAPGDKQNTVAVGKGTSDEIQKYLGRHHRVFVSAWGFSGAVVFTSSNARGTFEVDQIAAKRGHDARFPVAPFEIRIPKIVSQSAALSK